MAKIQERKLSVRDKMAIERAGARDATVKKALVGIRDRFTIDVDGGEDMHAKGNFVDHEYEIERDGDTIATVSKRWFRVRDTYGVEVAPGRTTRSCSRSRSASTRWSTRATDGPPTAHRRAADREMFRTERVSRILIGPRAALGGRRQP